MQLAKLEAEFLSAIRLHLGTGPALTALAVAVAAIVVLPSILNGYWLKVFTSATIYMLAASGVALLYARLGLVSLSQVALAGVGGWTSLRIAHATGLPFELNLLAGGLVTGVVGMLVGLPALRMRGLYLALITLMAAGCFHILVTAIQFPNGGEGFSGFTYANGQYMPRPAWATSDEAYFRYTIVVLLLGFILIEAHRRSRPGRAWALIRKSEACAMAAGVNVTLYKTWAFTLAGFLAGVAGGLLAGNIGVLDARSFPASESIMLFALTVVGGAYSWIGQVITGILYRAFPALLDSFGVDGNLAFAIFGVALLHALVTAPAGLAGQLARFAGKFGNKDTAK
ncbi:MAG: branched-chain amino acid ABC transporter permease [Burkholderiales bacterium]